MQGEDQEDHGSPDTDTLCPRSPPCQGAKWGGSTELQSLRSWSSSDSMDLGTRLLLKTQALDRWLGLGVFRGWGAETYGHMVGGRKFEPH